MGAEVGSVDAVSDIAKPEFSKKGDEEQHIWDFEADNSFRDNCIPGKFRLGGVPLAPRGPQIGDTFATDASGIFDLGAQDESRGKSN